ncbi:hypothetical protein D9M72_562940 [compost metagenome]
MDRAHLELPVLQELRDADALRPRVREIQLARDAAFEQVEMLDPAHARNDHVERIHARRIDLRERARQEVSLLLVVAFQHHAVAGRQHGLQEGDDVAGRDHLAVGNGCGVLLAARLGFPAGIPLAACAGAGHRVSGWRLSDGSTLNRRGAANNHAGK